MWPRLPQTAVLGERFDHIRLRRFCERHDLHLAATLRSNTSGPLHKFYTNGSKLSEQEIQSVRQRVIAFGNSIANDNINIDSNKQGSTMGLGSMGWLVQQSF